MHTDHHDTVASSPGLGQKFRPGVLLSPRPHLPMYSSHTVSTAVHVQYYHVQPTNHDIQLLAEHSIISSVIWILTVNSVGSSVTDNSSSLTCDMIV